MNNLFTKSNVFMIVIFLLLTALALPDFVAWQQGTTPVTF